jgi:stage II sporulation protein R
VKKFIALSFCIIGIAVVLLGLPAVAGQGGIEEDFLRLHIRANSNLAVDQDVKYKVREEIVNELTPIFSNVTSKRAAMETLNANLGRIETVADRVLAAAGFDYTARADLRTEYFPTRSYNEYSLPEGVYDALIINLGTGEGDNWWCVVYPPLCFLENNIGGDSGVKYKSKLQEIIKRYF